MIESRPGWACDVVLTVTNRSRWNIELSRVDAPAMGPTGDGEVEGRSVSAARLGEKFLGYDNPAGDSIDAWFWHREVRANSAESITLPIAWREAGCNSAGGFSFPDWPTVHFRSLGLHQEATSHQTLAFKTFDDAHDSSCLL